MRSHFDTIVAPITGAGPAPVAVIRISGPDAWPLAAALADRSDESLESRRAYFQTFETGDEGYVIFFEAGNSYTGDATAELSVHGSRASIRALVDHAIARGARLAEPGEFTQRRFMNGKIDLTEAEGVRDTIEAETAAQLRLANAIRDGQLHARITSLVHKLEGLLATIEANVDFSEEIGGLDVPDLASRTQKVIDEIAELAKTANIGRLLRQGLRVAIVGPPNAGKSSLLNRLVGHERSIVTEIAGTTRDYVEERVDVDGFPVVLIDTAGLRDTLDPVESIGVQRAKAVAAQADLIWFVTDPVSRELPKTMDFNRPMVEIANKVDLAPAPPGQMGICCLTGEGLLELAKTVASHFDNPVGLAIQERHEGHLEEATTDLSQALEVLAHGRPPDLAAVGIRNAIHALGRITGETSEADMIERIFRDFCIGK
jgi:tRNA modification GTPase